MNHRRSWRGYHSRFTLGAAGVALLTACTPRSVAAPRPSRPAPFPGQPWRAERGAVVARVNAARADLGLPALVYDLHLERVGDAHCMILIEEGGDGHFSRDGVPPYLRWLLAGGHGFHMENVGSFSTSAPIADSAVGEILARSVAGMLAESPPDDGHRRALLDPWVTHIGVGLARADGELRVTHELATEVAVEWKATPVVVTPGTLVELSGRLSEGWQPEVLGESLPRPLSDARLRTIRSYGYPSRRALLYPHASAGQAEERAFPGAWRRGPATVPFAVDQGAEFSYRGSTGSREGVELLLLWARHGRNPAYVPVAASATVVVGSGTLPPEFAFWYEVGRTFDRAFRGRP